jgi:hypothetical protein
VIPFVFPYKLTGFQKVLNDCYAAPCFEIFLKRGKRGEATLKIRMQVLCTVDGDEVGAESVV